MGIFDLFRKKTGLTTAQKKFNRMWDLWAEGKIESPYRDLMAYQSEVNNGGHSQFFFNLSNIGELDKCMAGLQQILPAKLKSNLLEAYQAYQTLKEDPEDEDAEDVFMDKADDVFYANEQEINRILEQYAETLTL